MNIIIGVFFLWVAACHLYTAINPSIVSRETIRWNAATLCLVTAFLALVFLGVIGPGPA